MQRGKMIEIANKLIQIGEEIKCELEVTFCTVYFKDGLNLTQFRVWPTWKTDEEVVEWCEANNITKWWR